MIFECPNGADSCSGGASSGMELCEEGYEGVLCAVCSDNYFYDSATNSCQICDGVNVFTPSLIVVFIVFWSIVLGYAVYYYYSTKESDDQGSRFISSDDLVVMYEWIEQRKAPIMGKVKIMTATFQIISSSALTLQVRHERVTKDKH